MARTRILTTVAIALVLAACGGSAGTATTPTTAPAATSVAASTTAAEPTTAPTEATEATAAPTEAVEATTEIDDTTAELDAERTVAEGGYTFQPPTNWTVESTGGTTTLNPDDLQAAFVIIGGDVLDGPLKEKLPSITTLDELMDEFLSNIVGEGVAAPEVSDRQDAVIGDTPARIAAIQTTENGQELIGQVVVARPQDQTVFVMLGLVPTERWTTMQATFEAVRDSVQLSDPTVATENATTEPENATTEPEATPATDATDTGASTPPTAADTTPGALCAATSGFGVTCLGDAGWQTFTADAADLGGDYITAVARCPDNRMVFGHTSGLSAWDGAAWTNYESWGTSSADAIACDADGGFWVAHFQGVSHFADGKWTTFGADKLATGAAANELVYDVALTPDGNVWVTTSQSVAMYDGTDWTVFQAEQGFDEQYFFAKLAVDGEGDVWAAHGNGVLEYADGTWTNYASPEYITPQALAVDGQGHVWLGTLSDGISVFNGEEWMTMTRDDGLSSNHINSIAFDGQGRGWVGTAYGLDVREGETWQAYHMHTSGLADNDIAALAVAGGGPALPSLETKESGSITAQVQNADNTPLAAAAVEVCVERLTYSFTGATPCSDQPLVKQTTTDAEGNFTVADLPPGRYSVTMATGENKWAQLTGDFGVGEGAEVTPGQENNLGTLTIKVE